MKLVHGNERVAHLRALAAEVAKDGEAEPRGLLGEERAEGGVPGDTVTSMRLDNA